MFLRKKFMGIDLRPPLKWVVLQSDKNNFQLIDQGIATEPPNRYDCALALAEQNILTKIMIFPNNLTTVDTLIKTHWQQYFAEYALSFVTQARGIDTTDNQQTWLTLATKQEYLASLHQTNPRAKIITTEAEALLKSLIATEQKLPPIIGLLVINATTSQIFIYQNQQCYFRHIINGNDITACQQLYAFAQLHHPELKPDLWWLTGDPSVEIMAFSLTQLWTTEVRPFNVFKRLSLPPEQGYYFSLAGGLALIGLAA